MVTKQITVFIENRKGRLGEILSVLKQNQVNILSTSLSDTSEYGLLRIISDKPQEGKDALSKAGFSSMLTDVFILELPHTPGGLQEVLTAIADEELSVEYIYGLSVEKGGASIVLKTSDLEKADAVFAKHGIKTLTYDNLNA